MKKTIKCQCLIRHCKLSLIVSTNCYDDLVEMTLANTTILLNKSATQKLISSLQIAVEDLEK